MPYLASWCAERPTVAGHHIAGLVGSVVEASASIRVSGTLRKGIMLALWLLDRVGPELEHWGLRRLCP